LLAIEDITERRQREQGLQDANEFAESIIQSARDPLLILDADLRVHAANAAFYGTFQLGPNDVVGRAIDALGEESWNVPELRRRLAEVVSGGRAFDDFELTRDFLRLGPRTLLLNARPLRHASGQPARILLGIHDVTRL